MKSSSLKLCITICTIAKQKKNIYVMCSVEYNDYDNDEGRCDTSSECTLLDYLPKRLK